MSNIISGHTHSFDTGIAIRFGINSAAVYNHLCYWIRHNRIQGKNIREEKCWTYQTIEDMQKYLPYLSYKQIRDSLDRLVDADLVIKGNFNSTKMDRKSWYSTTSDSYLSDLPPILTENTQVPEKEPFALQGKCNCPTGQMEMPHRADLSLYSNTSKKSENRDAPNAPSETAVAVPTKSLSSLKKLKQLPKKIERVPNVSTTEEEHQKLVSKHGLPLVEKCYVYLSEWKESKLEADPKSVGKHTDYHRINKWVISAVQEEDSKNKLNKTSKTSEVSFEEIERRHVSTIKYIEKHWNQLKQYGFRITEYADKVEINYDRCYETLYYKDVKFMELMNHHMKKMWGSIKNETNMNPTD